MADEQQFVNQGITRILEKGGTYSGEVENAIDCLSQGPVVFEKIAGYHGIGTNSFLAFLIIKHTVRTIPAICTAMERAGTMEWEWGLH